jgi:hypothetical protein
MPERNIAQPDVSSLTVQQKQAYDGVLDGLGTFITGDVGTCLFPIKYTFLSLSQGPGRRTFSKYRTDQNVSSLGLSLTPH